MVNVNERPELDIFDNVPLEDINNATKSIRRAKYTKGEYLFNTGDPADSLFILESGLVKISYITIDGNERILDMFESGDIFGELFLGKYKHRIGQALALDDVVVYRLNERDLQTLIHDYPAIGMNLIRHLVDEQREIIARMHALLTADAQSRLLGTLLSIARRYCCTYQNEFVLNDIITQEDLANLSGLNRSTVSSLINSLRRDGILGGAGRSLIINKQKVEALLEDSGFDLLE